LQQALAQKNVFVGKCLKSDLGYGVTKKSVKRLTNV
jgi:hypothetical protein